MEMELSKRSVMKMATVTEASLKQQAMDVLSQRMRDGQHSQHVVDTALEVLAVLRDEPAGVEGRLVPLWPMDFVGGLTDLLPRDADVGYSYPPAPPNEIV